jgi:hypothetical protein
VMRRPGQHDSAPFARDAGRRLELKRIRKLQSEATDNDPAKRKVHCGT